MTQAAAWHARFGSLTRYRYTGAPTRIPKNATTLNRTNATWATCPHAHCAQQPATVASSGSAGSSSAAPSCGAIVHGCYCCDMCYAWCLPGQEGRRYPISMHRASDCGRWHMQLSCTYPAQAMHSSTPEIHVRPTSRRGRSAGSVLLLSIRGRLSVELLTSGDACRCQQSSGEKASLRSR